MKNVFVVVDTLNGYLRNCHQYPLRRLRHDFDEKTYWMKDDDDVKHDSHDEGKRHEDVKQDDDQDDDEDEGMSVVMPKLTGFLMQTP